MNPSRSVGRPGISKQNVRDAIKTLLLAGNLDPSARAIRHALHDTGSFEIINKHLKAIRNECLSTALLELADNPAVTLPEALQHLVLELWEKLQTTAQQESTALNEAAQQRVDQAEAALKTGTDRIILLEQNVEKATTQINHLNADLKIKTGEWKEEREARLVFEERNAQLLDTNAQLRHQLQTRIQELETYHQHILTNLEAQHKQAVTKLNDEQHQQQAHSEAQRGKLMFEIDEWKTAHKKLELNCGKVESENKHLREQLKESEKRHRHLDIELAKSQQQQSGAEQALLLVQAELNFKQKALEDAQAKVEKLSEEIGGLRIQVLAAQSPKFKKKNPKPSGE